LTLKMDTGNMDIKWRLKMLEILGALIVVNIVLGVLL